MNIRLNRLVVLLGLVLNLGLGCNQSEGQTLPEVIDDHIQHPDAENTFENPLLSSGADPWVIKGTDSYFYTHTTGSTLKLWETAHMEDLAESNPKTIWTPPQGAEYSTQIWAPELHYIAGAWYMYFAATSHNSDEKRRMFVLENTSESPMDGTWEFKGKISDETDQWAIDGTVMQIEEENYFVWSGWRTADPEENSGRQQLYIARMQNPWTLEGSRVMISEPSYFWEQNGLVNEGPVAWENSQGTMYLFYSASGCWTDDYKVGVLTYNGGDPLDPQSWEKHPDPLFEKAPGNNVFAPGHNSFFKSPDGSQDWILYHANDTSGDGCTDSRKPRMQQIHWDENGFPDLGIPVNNTESLLTPSS